jgi:hypothetical protein
MKRKECHERWNVLLGKFQNLTTLHTTQEHETMPPHGSQQMHEQSEWLKAQS